MPRACGGRFWKLIAVLKNSLQKMHGQFKIDIEK